MSSKLPRAAIETIYKKLDFEHEIRREIDVVETRIREKRQETYIDFARSIADQAGVDIQRFYSDGLIRNKVQRRLRETAYQKIRAKARQFAKDEAARCRKAEAEFCKTHFANITKSEGNPCLLVWQPSEDFEPRVLSRTDEPGGMVGYACKAPDLAVREYEGEMELATEYSHRNHVFYPRAYAAAGADDEHVYQSVEQTIVVERRPLEPGAGNFRVDGVQLWLSGVGYYELNEGSAPLFGPGSLGPTAEASVSLYVDLIQRTDFSSDGFSYFRILDLPNYWQRQGSGSGMVRIGPYHDRAAFPADIVNPDSGGHEIYVCVSLTCLAGAYQNEAWAEIDFTRPDYDGLNLIDVRLCHPDH